MHSSVSLASLALIYIVVRHLPFQYGSVCASCATSTSQQYSRTRLVLQLISVPGAVYGGGAFHLKLEVFVLLKPAAPKAACNKDVPGKQPTTLGVLRPIPQAQAHPQDCPSTRRSRGRV